MLLSGRYGVEEDDEFDREYVVHGDGEYADGEVHVNTGETTVASGTRGSRLIEASPRTS